MYVVASYFLFLLEKGVQKMDCQGWFHVGGWGILPLIVSKLTCYNVHFVFDLGGSTKPLDPT